MLQSVLNPNRHRYKSSLINALINENNLLPVDVDVTTDRVITVTQGPKEKISQKIKEKTKAISRKELQRCSLIHSRRSSIEQNSPINIELTDFPLPQDLILADTPCFGSLNKNLTKITYLQIPKVDAVLFVSDTLCPLTTNELGLIEYINYHNLPIIFVITKIDQCEDFEEVIENNQKKLTKTLNGPIEKITIIPVSSYLKNMYLKYKRSEDLVDSNFSNLEREIQSSSRES